MSIDVDDAIERIEAAEAKMTFDICQIERDEYAREAYDLVLAIEAAYDESLLPNHQPFSVNTARTIVTLLKRYGLR